MNLRVWSERLSYEELAAPAVLDLLRRYDVSLGVQVTPVQRSQAGDALLTLIRRAAEAGVPLALWPILDEEAGPWANERNVEDFGDFVDELLDWTESESTKVSWIAVDLQMPREQAERYTQASGLGWFLQLFRLMRSNLSRKRFMAASGEFQTLQTCIMDYGAHTVARVMDPVVADLATDGIAWQDFLETPVTTVTWEYVALTYYGSVVSGSNEVRGPSNIVGKRATGVAPADARSLLYQACQAVQARYGDHAIVSLGLCGAATRSGESFYATPADLQPDVAAALAAGVQDIALADLAGILQSPEPGAWFEMVRTCTPVAPAVTEWARRATDNRQQMARLFGYFQ